MRFNVILVFILVLFGFSNETFAQIYPEDDVCRNGNWVYYYLNALYEGNVEWEVKGGILDTSGTVAVKWNPSATNLEIKATYKNNLGSTQVATLNPEFKEVGNLYRVWIRDQQTSYCAGETILFEADPSGTLTNNPYYYWTIYDNVNGDIVHRDTTTSDQLPFIIPDDLHDIYLSVHVKTGNASCNIFSNTVNKKKILIKNCGFRDIDFDFDQPLCKGDPAAELRLDNIPNPQTTSGLYDSIQADDKDYIDFTLTRYAAYAVITASDTSCSGSIVGQSVKPEYNEIVKEYVCPSGYVANYTMEYTGPYVALPPDSIVLTERVLVDSTWNILYDLEGNPDTVWYNVYGYDTISRGLTDGIYTVDVENPLFCPFKTFFVVEEPPALDVKNAVGKGGYSYNGGTKYNIPVIGGSDSIELTIEGGTKDYSYELFNEAKSKIGSGKVEMLEYYIKDEDTTYTVSGAVKGENYIYIYDDHGCMNMDSATLTEPEPIKISGFVDQKVSCNALDSSSVENYNDGQFQFDVKNGIGPYYLKIDNVEHDSTEEDKDSSLTSKDLSVDTYTLNITDKYGNFKDTIATIEEPSEIQIEFTDTIDPVCLGNPDGKLVVSADGGEADFNLFQLQTEIDGDAIFTSEDTLGNIDAQSTYYVKVENVNECYQYKEFHSGNYSNPLYYEVLDSISPVCIGGDDGKIILKGKGGHDNMYDASRIEDYLDNKVFYTSDSTIEISGLESSSYTIKIKDTENCEFEREVQLLPNSNAVKPLLIDSAEITCNTYDDGSIQVTGQKGDKGVHGYEYYIMEGSGFHDGIYTDKVAKQTGDTVTYDNLQPGSYSIYIADTNDCLVPGTDIEYDAYRTGFYVYEPPVIEVSHTNTGVSQKGETDAKFWFTAKGGNNSYDFELWSADTLVTDGNTNDSVLIDNLAEGEYTLKLKDTCDCTKGANLDWLEFSGIRIESPNEFLQLVTGAVEPASCHGANDGSVTIYGKGGWESSGYTFGIDSVDIYNNGIFENLSSGWYLFHVKDSANVTVYDSIYVPQPEPLQATIKNIIDVQCHQGSDGQAALSVTGGTKPYTFSKDGTTWQQDSLLTGFAKGHYAIHVRDANGCETFVEVDINQPEPFSVDYQITETLCGEANGALECNVSGATQPYYFEWSDGVQVIGTDSIIDNLFSGEYSITITDAHGCDTSFVLAVSNTDGPQITLDSTQKVSCKGKSDGEIYFSITEGVAPYRAKLYTGSMLVCDTTLSGTGSFTFKNLQAANYKIMVYDTNNCLQSIDQVLLLEPESVNIILDEISHPVCYGYADGQLTVHAEGGNGDYLYEWSTGESSNALQNISAGTYAITATDAKGCYTETSYELIDPEKLTVDIGEEEMICEGQTYPLSAEGYTTYNWLFNGESISSAPEIEAWAEGEYVIEVTDNDGCFASDTFSLTINNDLLEADFLMPSEAYENDTVVAIDISWPEPENIQWSFSEGIVSIHSETYIEEFTFENSGTYQVSLTSYKAMCVDSVSK